MENWQKERVNHWLVVGDVAVLWLKSILVQAQKRQVRVWLSRLDVNDHSRETFRLSCVTRLPPMVPHDHDPDRTVAILKK